LGGHVVGCRAGRGPTRRRAEGAHSSGRDLPGPGGLHASAVLLATPAEGKDLAQAGPQIVWAGTGNRPEPAVAVRRRRSTPGAGPASGGVRRRPEAWSR